jgi:undecaprenyl-diphosphatase
MIEQLIIWDKSLLLYLNGLNSPFWDFVMYWISDKFIWIPFYLFLIYLVMRNYKIRTIDVLVAAAVLVALTDNVSVYCFKEVFQRLRPCQDPTMQPLVHLVNGECGGLYSFVSSHAANTFGVCFFLINILGRKVKYLTPGMIIWASVVSYTRIYLGVHYPLDVLCGAIVGILIGMAIGKTFNWYYKKYVLKIEK